MPHSNDIQMMINHDHDKYSPITPQTQTQTQAGATSTSTSTSTSSSSLSYDSLCSLLIHRDAKEMRHLRQLLRQHLTWQERIMEWSKFLLNIVVAIIAVVVGIQTLQSRVNSVQSTVDALSGTVNQVHGNVERLSTSIKQSQQDVTKLQNDAAGLNHTMIGINGQLYDIQELSSQLAYNISQLNVSQVIQQVQGLHTQINALTNQSIIWNNELIHAQIQLQQQNISTYTQFNQLAISSSQHITSLIPSVTQLLQPIQQQQQQQQQNLTRISADVSRRVHSIGFCNYSSPTSGAAGGYEGVRSLCRFACSSDTARECSSSDIFRQYYDTRLALPQSSHPFVWVSSPTISYYTSSHDNKQYTIYNCGHWLNGNGNFYGNTMTVAPSYPDSTTIMQCNNQLPFACCDHVQ